MKNVFERSIDLDSLKDKPLSDYNPSELVAYLLKAYPGDPKGALKMLIENNEVGYVLGSRTEILLEGLSKC